MHKHESLLYSLQVISMYTHTMPTFQAGDVRIPPPPVTNPEVCSYSSPDGGREVFLWCTVPLSFLLMCTLVRWVRAAAHSCCRYGPFHPYAPVVVFDETACAYIPRA